MASDGGAGPPGHEDDDESAERVDPGGRPGPRADVLHRGAGDAGLAGTLSTWDAETRHLLGTLFARAVREGELPPGIDHRQLARALLAFAAGLAAQLLYDPVPEAEVRALVDRTVEALLTPPG